jgi:ATP-dependent DNA ligase
MPPVPLESSVVSFVTIPAGDAITLIRLITRRGNDWSDRFPLVVEAVNHLKVQSCLIDGEVVCCDEEAEEDWGR